MKSCALSCLIGLVLTFSQQQLRADISPPTVSTNQADAGFLLAWSASVDPNVAGYYLAWGSVSGNATNLVDLGNVTGAVVTSLTPGAPYYFTIVAYDSAGNQALPSNEIQYTVGNPVAGNPPNITDDLTNQTLAAGLNTTLYVGVSGTSPFTFEWFFNGSAITGATTNSLNLDSLTSAQAGAYQVVISNSAGSITSSVANIAVLYPPSITLDVTNETIATGGTAIFAANVAGSSPLGFSWLFNGAVLQGANSDPLVLNNVSGQQVGTYQVIVSNSVGSVTGNVATLSVLVPPSITQDLTNQSISVGSTVSLTVQATGTDPLGYQWRFGDMNFFAADTNSLVLPNVGPSQAGNYQVIITNAAGSVTSSVATITVLVPPAIITDISNQTVAAGSQTTFNLNVTGTTPLAYQWFYNGSPLPGATTNPLVLSKVSTSESGTYQVSISNLLGTAQSSVATLTVLQNKMLHAHQFSSSLISLSFAAAPLQSYTVQSSTNLSGPWTIVGTISTDGYGVLNYDVDLTTPAKFYRITSP